MPFQNSALSRIGSNLTDGGLRVTLSSDVGKSVLIIGSASDGPVNVPVRLADIGGIRNAYVVFGDASKGTLLHTAYEAQHSNRKAKDIRLLRISNGNEAFLSLKERAVPDTTVKEESYWFGDTPILQIEDVLVLTALYPGQIYNRVSIRSETGDGDTHPKSQYIVIYNPKTAVESWYSFDYTSFTTDVDCHTVQDLADAINADSNMNTILNAEVRTLHAEFEMKLSDPANAGNTLYDEGIVRDSNGYIKITLSTRTPIYVTSGPVQSGIGEVTVTGGAANVPTVGNLIDRIVSMYELKEFTETLELKGLSTGVLSNVPIKGSDALGTETLIRYIQTTFANEYDTAQILLYYRGITVDTIEATSTMAYTFSSEVCPDDGLIWGYYGPTQAMVVANTLQARSVVSGEWSSFHLYATASGLQYEVPSGDYKLAYDTGDEEVTLTFDTAKVPPVGTLLTCDYNAVVEDLSSEAGSLTAVLASEDWHQYFVAGKAITFGTALPADASFRYRYKYVFEEGADFVVTSDATYKNNVIQFSNLATQPELSGSLDAAPVTVGFDYYYLPEWLYLPQVKTLAGGTDGVNMDNAEKYEALDTAFKSVADYPVSYVVLAGMYFDDVKTVYDPRTGTPTVVNAGFVDLLHTYLEELTGSTSETVGVISVQPADSNTPTAIANWVTNLTVVDAADTNRAANKLASFGSKYISIVAMEPVFSNEAAFVPYVGTGEGVYAGLLSSLPVNTAPTNKNVFGVVGLRYNLSGGSDGQLDKLTSARLATLRQNQTGDIVTTAGVTAAAAGSDYAREMTRNVVFEAMALVRVVCEPFLGEGNSPQIRAAMETAINAGLQKMVDMNPPALQAYDFTLKSTATDQVNGVVNIDLVLVPVFELREIRVTVKLRAQL